MNFYQTRRLKVIRNYGIAWTAAFVFLAVVRGVGTTETGSLKFDFLSSFLIALTLGPIMGSFSALAQLWMEESIYRKTTIIRFLVLRLLYATSFIIVLILIAYAVYQLYFGTTLDIISFAFDEGSFAVYFYVLSADFVITVFRQLSMMLGERNFSKLLRGQFYEPREERRIFMFLDLRSSTTLAEKLGHAVYSRLIQDCFNDLGVVIEFGAEIYQYVGDEAVITWEFHDGIKNHRFLKAFFRFKKQLRAREDYYLSTYGIKPFFKAGIHEGVVMITEIGKYKREIAYHGDAINTAARIQGQCNALGQELLISESLASRVDQDLFSVEKLSSVQLRGKQEEISIYSVEMI